ncbi:MULTISPECIES: hypothetical protein [unclassified Oleiphilus]|jgi:uncharacterized membrane protein YidH (DUF202 family)|uniref:hypothetical protein n=1 Tax=unclassified Oleiphilus TaxID=2631174 RepID=UPI000AC304B4|nr:MULTISPECIES: hypothetical protein [unclassified Oleiphilus]
MNKMPFSLQVTIFLVTFSLLAIYMVGGLETEDGKTLLVIVLIGGLISTLRAAYLRNKQIKKAIARQKELS